MLEPVVHPWYLRVADTAHARLEARGRPLVSFVPQALEARARRGAGLNDFGDSDFEEGLAVLCHSAETDADLSLFGRVMLHSWLVNALTQRLRRAELRRTRPEIFEQPLNRPVIIVGLPRSGTTLLHRMVARTPDARPLLAWELHEPLAGPGLDLRRARTRFLLSNGKRAAKALDAKHRLTADEPEECVMLLDDSMLSFTYWMFFPVYSYLDWLKAQDHRAPYRTYREYLQVFQAQHPDRRLVLKCPFHAAHLTPLLEAVPEAIVIQTHRDPVPVMGSVNSLFHTVHGIMARSQDHTAMSRINLEAMGWTMDRNLAQRAELPSDRVLDLRYDDLVANPLAAVQRVCRHSALGFDEQAVATWLANRPQHHYGRHDYSIAEHGLTEAEVRGRFAAYSRRFLDGPAPATSDG